MTDETPNPVIRRTQLNAYPGWVVREYADGMFDGVKVGTIAITAGCNSFQEVVAIIREMEGR